MKLDEKKDQYGHIYTYPEMPKDEEYTICQGKHGCGHRILWVDLVDHLLHHESHNKIYKRTVMKVNLNQFSNEITLEEGKKISISVAQVKEVLRITFKKLGKMSFREVIQLLGRYK